MNTMLKNRRTPPSPLGTMTVAEARAKVADFRRKALRSASWPIESIRLSKAADDLAAKIELHEKQTAAASKATQPKTPSKADVTSQLEEAFRAGGMTEAQAKVAARGRRIREAVRNVAGLTAASFAWVADPEDPTTWKLQLQRSEDGDRWSPDEDLVRAAVAQLQNVGSYGSSLDIPAGDLPAVKAKLRSAWIACGAPVDEMPPELNEEALRRAFMASGLSEDAAAVAARGRRRI